MIYSCKDVTLQNRKFSEFIDIDNEELLPGSVDNDTIYLSGYVEGDENNQNIKIKVSQLAEKVATDADLVTKISQELIKPETDITGIITEKVKDTVAEYINGDEEGGPSEVDQIIDEAITDRLDEANYATKDDIKNFVSKDDYASEENAGLVKLQPVATTFSSRTVVTNDSTEGEVIPSVYTAEIIDEKLIDLKNNINGHLSDVIADKVSYDDFNIVITDVDNLKGLDISGTFDDHSELIKNNEDEIEKINTEIGESNIVNDSSIWGSIDNLINEVSTKMDKTEYEKFVNETFEDFKQLSNNEHDRLENDINELKEKCENDKAALEGKLTNDIEKIDAKLGSPVSGELICNAWNKIYSLTGDITSLNNKLFGFEDDIRDVLRIANGAFSITTNFDDDIKLLREKVDNIDSNYITIDVLDSKNFISEDIINKNIELSLTESKEYTDSKISKLDEDIETNKDDIAGLRTTFDNLNSTIPAITLNASTALNIAKAAENIATEAKDLANSFDEKISLLKVETDKIATIEEKNLRQDNEIKIAKADAQSAIDTANDLKKPIDDLDNDINGENGIKVTLVAYGNQISDIEELVGTGPIDISSLEHIHKLDENATVIAHINNINNAVDELRENTDDHDKLLKSHSTRLDELTEAIGGYGKDEEKRPCVSGLEFIQKYEMGEWPNNFSKIKDLWSGLYSIANIVGFDHQDKLPSDPDDRNIITILDGKTEQINQNTERIDELDDKINAFNVAIDTASLYIPGMVSIIAYNDDGNRPQVTETATTAVSIDYFERHKPSSFSEDDDEDAQYHRKGTVYVQYKNQDDNEQPIVYSKAAIDSKLDEEYSKKDSGLNYNTDGVTFSLGNNNNPQIPQNIENVPIPMNCPAMCVTREGIYVTVFYGDGGVTSPQGNNNNTGWRWVMLGTVPQEFVASDTSGPVTRS